MAPKKPVMAPARKKQPVKVVKRLVTRSGGTIGEAKGVVRNLRAKPGSTLTPRGQVQLSRKIARNEGLRPKAVKKLVKAERTIARNSRAKKG